jgi:sulfur carrier protein
VRLRVNGEWRDSDAPTLDKLLESLGVDRDQKGIAVAVNDEVVRRARWETTPLRENDEIEVIHAVQGG